MSRRYYPPASLRFLKARLWNLARPSFWVTAIFLSLVGLLIKEYWTNPDFFSQQRKPQVASHKSADPSLSEEDKAVAADIDSLPVLYKDAEQATAVQEKTQLTNGKGLSDDSASKYQVNQSRAESYFSRDTANSSSAPKLENPFVAQAENLLKGGVYSSTASSIQSGVVPNSSSIQSGVVPNSSSIQSGVVPNSSSIQSGVVPNSSSIQSGVVPNSSSIQSGVVPTSIGLGVGSANQTNYSQSAIPVSPSQTTINNPSTAQNLPSFNSNTTSIGANPYVGQSLPTNNSPSQITPAITGVSRNTLTPSTVTGYTQPLPTTQQQNPYSSLNPYSDLQSHSQSFNRFSNRYNNSGSGQAYPSSVPSTSVVSPATYAAPTYTTPYYPQTQSSGVVSPYYPSVTNNYGSSGSH